MEVGELGGSCVTAEGMAGVTDGVGEDRRGVRLEAEWGAGGREEFWHLF